MALIGFPNQIRVRLGSTWPTSGNEGGLDLHEGDYLILNKISPGLYSQSGSPSANQNTNKIKLTANSGGSINALFTLCKSTTDDWNTNYFWRMKASVATYNFKDLWLMGSLVPTTQRITLGCTFYWVYGYPSRGNYSMTQSIFTGGSDGLVAGGWYNKLFSEYEEEVDDNSSSSSSEGYSSSSSSESVVQTTSSSSMQWSSSNSESYQPTTSSSSIQWSSSSSSSSSIFYSSSSSSSEGWADEYYAYKFGS